MPECDVRAATAERTAEPGPASPTTKTDALLVSEETTDFPVAPKGQGGQAVGEWVRLAIADFFLSPTGPTPTAAGMSLSDLLATHDGDEILRTVPKPAPRAGDIPQRLSRPRPRPSPSHADPRFPKLRHGSSFPGFLAPRRTPGRGSWQ